MTQRQLGLLDRLAEADAADPAEIRHYLVPGVVQLAGVTLAAWDSNLAGGEGQHRFGTRLRRRARPRLGGAGTRTLDMWIAMTRFNSLREVGAHDVEQSGRGVHANLGRKARHREPNAVLQRCPLIRS